MRAITGTNYAGKQGELTGVAAKRLSDSPSLNNGGDAMIRKLRSGEFRLYSRKKDARTGKRKNLGTFSTRGGAEKHERAVQFFKRRG